MSETFTLDEITETAQRLYNYAKPYKIWAFYGEMGSGKTTLIAVLCKQIFKVKDAVSSPTFALINEYQTSDKQIIYHIDLYRIQSTQEAMNAGIEDCLNSGNLCLIEWAQNAAALLPEGCFHIYLEVINNTTRKIYTSINSINI